MRNSRKLRDRINRQRHLEETKVTNHNTTNQNNKNHPELFVPYDTRPGNEVGLFYQTRGTCKKGRISCRQRPGGYTIVQTDILVLTRCTKPINRSLLFPSEWARRLVQRSYGELQLII